MERVKAILQLTKPNVLSERLDGLEAQHIHTNIHLIFDITIQELLDHFVYPTIMGYRILPRVRKTNETVVKLSSLIPSKPSYSKGELFKRIVDNRITTSSVPEELKKMVLDRTPSYYVEVFSNPKTEEEREFVNQHKDIWNSINA